MTGRTVVAVVTRLYVAAGRKAAEGEFLVWQEALDDLPDDHAEDVARFMVREMEFDGAPAPAAFRRERTRWISRHVQHRAITESSAILTDDERAANRARLSAELERLRQGSTP